MDRAYAVLTVKALDAERRTLTGIASTPTPDRHGDIFEPLGATFTNPVPLLLHHDQARPIGTAELTASADGIAFVATLADVREPGALRDRIVETLQAVSCTPPLIRGTSIGFRPLKDGLKYHKATGGFRLTRTEICELSLVTIPANVEATIHTIKSFATPAASGQHPPGVAGSPTRTTMQTTAEQITQWENKRAALAARLGELLTKSGAAGETLPPEDAEEYDSVEGQISQIDGQLTRLRHYEKSIVASATPANGNGHGAGTTPPAPYRSLSIKPNVPPAAAFTRYTMAMLRAKGDSMRALEYAKAWRDSTPEVELMVKAAVAPGTTTDAAWAGALVQITNATNEFIELLRPATILGRIPNLRRVPFNTSVPIQTSGGTYKWVGQAKAKPVGKLQFGSTTLKMSKAAGIIVLTEELVRSSSPSAEAIVRADMIAGIAAFLDSQFIDPAVAAVADVSPASITNGITGTASSDDPYKDLSTLAAAFATANMSLKGLTVILSEANAFHMSWAQDVQGNRLFPGMTVDGGSANGINIVASNAAGGNVIAVAPQYILFADDGGVSIDVSREATIQMNDAPMSPTDATTVMTSLWQDNLVGLRAERFINWLRATNAAVAYVTDANYAPAGT